MPAPDRRKPIQLGLEHALHSRPPTHNPFTLRTMAWAHYLIGYQYGLRILRVHRGAPRVRMQ
jgi:hypothetical protein